MAHIAAAGSAAITEEIYGSVKQVVWAWTSGTGETVVADCTTANFYSGKLMYCVTVPGTSGDAPTDNYDVTILDKNNIDVLDHSGFNRDATSTETIPWGSLGTVANSQLELNIAAAGSANTGVVYLWIR